ncbi:hypothetical protein GOODEAATRI_017392, partial [Goodea atripinnis]
RPDEEVVVDQGGTSSVMNIHYEKEELEGHRTLFVGVRMPRQSYRHHKPHGSRHRKKDKRAGSITNQQNEESEAAGSSHGNKHLLHTLHQYKDLVNIFTVFYNSYSHACTCMYRLLPKRSILLIILTWLYDHCTSGKNGQATNDPNRNRN